VVQNCHNKTVWTVFFGAALSPCPRHSGHLSIGLLSAARVFGWLLSELLRAISPSGSVAVRCSFGEADAQETCLAPFERLYAEVPGDITPCCFMGSHRMGNVYESGVEAVWFSTRMQALRKSRHLPACTTCTLYNPFDDDISHLSAYLIEKNGPRAVVPAKI
jgi:hypothetical protein